MVDERTWDEIVIPGIIGGVVAGLAATVPACVASAIAGQGLFRPLELIAAAVLPANTPLHALWPIVTGLALNLLTAAALGILYNAIVPRGEPYPWAALVALTFAISVWLLVTWLLLPWLDEPLYRTYPPPLTLLYFLVYGAVLPLTIAVRRTVTEDIAHRPPREIEA
ncbi:MAG: hypothetical protein IRZ16_12800 [Myxococcaceae bacterium]|nr:hypothetical protein [Myxococcaceae bacterium]